MTKRTKCSNDRGAQASNFQKYNCLNHEGTKNTKKKVQSCFGENFSSQLSVTGIKMKEKGYTVIPTRLYLNEKGLAKLEIALARGKKLYDKREDLKKKDDTREMARIKKDRI